MQGTQVRNPGELKCGVTVWDHVIRDSLSGRGWQKLETSNSGHGIRRG